MGKLVLYIGPMKSGKTTALLNRYVTEKQVSSTPEKFLICKPQIDNRFAINEIVSRNGDRLNCTNISNIDDMLDMIENYTEIFIDEFQFLKGNINKLIETSFTDINYYIAGLNLTAERKPFGLMDKLFPYATEINLFAGNCDICGELGKGIYSYYKGSKLQDIMIGDEDYLCVCNKCYQKCINTL